MNLKTGLIAAALLFSSSLTAHDVWLEAEPFYAKTDETVDIGIYVGSDMVGEELPNLLTWYTDFSYFSTAGRQDVEGEMARIPAGFIEIKEPGTYVVGYRSTNTGIELESEKFTSYLKKQGLEKIILARQQQGKSDDIGRERFSRAVKTLIKIGKDSQADFANQEFGYTLELIPLQNPYQLKIGESLNIILKYQGNPLSGVLITAFTKDLPEQKFQTRTNDDGEVRIVLDHPGVWLIKAVEMVAIEHDKYDWESFWASLTFQLK